MSRKLPWLFLALLSGALTALAFPKFNLSYLAWISLIPLFFVLSRSRPKQAFWNGLASGFAFYGILLYWIPDVPAHYGDLPLGLSLILFLILIFLLAGFWALFGLSFATVRQAFPEAAYIFAPFCWVSFEYAMTYVLTGFPWGILGYSQSENIPFLQLAPLTGVYGLSFVLIFVQSAFVLFLTRRKRTPIAAAVALVVIIHAAGMMSSQTIVPSKSSFTASVVQGNVSSDIAWEGISDGENSGIFKAHLDLTRQAYGRGARLIIWPEFTVPLCFSCPEGIYEQNKSELSRFVLENPCTLLLGTIEMSGPPGSQVYYNTALCLHPDLSMTQYAKMHLVPFGEYTPYKKIFFFVEELTHSVGDIEPGKRYVLHEHAGLKFGSPICYEVIFPDLVRRFTKMGADFLVTITNDGWYGRTSAPSQHFAIAIFRAVENRRFLLRAATTGISGIIDPYGRVLVESRLMTRTYLTGRVTPSRKMTFYAEHGDVLAWVSLTLSIIFFIMSMFKKTREREHHGLKRTLY